MKQLYEDDDEKLLLLISRGDRVAFSYLYNRYGNNLLRFVSGICFSKEISEEIVQDLFLNIWLNRENITQVRAIKPYLYRSAKNMVLNHLRSVNKAAKVIKEISASYPQEAERMEDKIVYNEAYVLAQSAIELLPSKRKLIFKMRHDDNLSLDEISTRLSISKSVVKKQLYSGINFVRTYLSKHGDIITFLVGISLYLKK